MRTNRLRTYAASGFVRAALTAGSYGVVTHGSGTDAPDPREPPLLWRIQPPPACLRPLRPRRSASSDPHGSSRGLDTSRRAPSAPSSSRSNVAASEIAHSSRRRR